MTRVDELHEFACYGALHPDDCVMWPYATTGSGYPNLVVDGTNVAGHRWVCEQWHGPPGDGQEVSHSCGRSVCVNPHHVTWATHGENVAMKREHGTENDLSQRVHDLENLACAVLENYDNDHHGSMSACLELMRPLVEGVGS